MQHPTYRRYLRPGSHGRPQLDPEKVRTLKHTLDLRSLYHRVEERIRAHVVLCWLALLLVWVIRSAAPLHRSAHP